MKVSISTTVEQETFIREAISSGRFQTAEDAAREALSQWEERERRRAELLLDLDAAEASLAQGEGRRLTIRSLDKWTDEVKQHGRSRLRRT